jgi:hypothetical protein
MAEKDTIFESKIKNSGIFNFAEFYKFCYDWLADEVQLDITEENYTEKLSGDSKNIDVKWTCTRKVTDYFKFEIKVAFRVLGMRKVEVQRDGIKEKTNDGSVEVKVKGTLVKDYEGKFEKSGFQKFLREIYQKWVIPSRINEYEGKLIGDCDEFLVQAKAFLDLEGRK